MTSNKGPSWPITCMSFRKYQSVEKVKVLSPEENAKVALELHKLGKTSARQLTDEERVIALKREALDTNRVI